MNINEYSIIKQEMDTMKLNWCSKHLKCRWSRKEIIPPEVKMNISTHSKKLKMFCGE
jgi:hypothetical protein